VLSITIANRILILIVTFVCGRRQEFRGRGGFWICGGTVARVTLVPSRTADPQQRQGIGVRPDIENRIKAGEIIAHFQQHGAGNRGGDYVALRTPSGSRRLKNDFVFALTGYHPDYDFLSSVGIELSPDQLRPRSAIPRIWEIECFRESTLPE